jgi:hypothetical protein
MTHLKRGLLRANDKKSFVNDKRRAIHVCGLKVGRNNLFFRCFLQIECPKSPLHLYNMVYL